MDGRPHGSFHPGMSAGRPRHPLVLGVYINPPYLISSYQPSLPYINPLYHISTHSTTYPPSLPHRNLTLPNPPLFRTERYDGVQITGARSRIHYQTSYARSGRCSCKHTISTQPFNASHLPTTLTLHINLPSQYTLLTHFTNTPYQRTLSMQVKAASRLEEEFQVEIWGVVEGGNYETG